MEVLFYLNLLAVCFHSPVLVVKQEEAINCLQSATIYQPHLKDTTLVVTLFQINFNNLKQYKKKLSSVV